LNSKVIIFLLISTLILTGCNSSQDEAAPSQQNNSTQEQPLLAIKPVTLMIEPVEATRVETATAALPIWRNYAAHKPALILFSNDPFLTPVPAPLHDQVMQLIRTGNPAQIKSRAVDISPNPLLMHSMAVEAALQAGFFSELVWVLPLKDEESLPPLAQFRQQMLDNGMISQAESESFAAEGNHYIADLRGIPVKIGTLAHIPLPKSPAWVHIDLSIFKPLYKNEVSTPLYPLVFSSLKKIREAGISSIGATISQSNLGGALSLKIRFLGKDLRHILMHPASIDEELPELQFRRTQNLYLEQFMKKEEILENCLKMEALAPEDASVKFDLYHANREMQGGNQALEYLAQAVALDPMYAYEYFYLAETAVERNRPDAALKMVEKARETFPDNPMTLIMEADINLVLGHRETALKLLTQAQTLPWSKVYDPDMHDRLERMKKIAAELPAAH